VITPNRTSVLCSRAGLRLLKGSKPERRRFVGAFVAAALLILVASLTSKGAELSPETLTAWDAYVQAQNARIDGYSSATPFLWSDQSPDRLRRLHSRETVVCPFGDNPHRVPQGLIHHWIVPFSCLELVCLTFSL
jgi:hypothetical protein